jgi:hypothetical protein
MGTWMDPDGLYRTYGTDRATANIGGEHVTTGGLREIEVKIDLTTLTESETVLSDTIFFPKSMRIHEVEVITVTAATLGTAIDLGLVRTDRTTEIDYNGLLAAFPTANMNVAGERHIMVLSATVPTGATGTGALIGTTTSQVGLLTCSRTDATAFGAGVIIVKIRYFAP